MDCSPTVPVRIVLAVTPRLLADSLALVFRDHGLDVQDVAAGVHEPVDVAVVSRGVDFPSAELVLEIDDASGSTARATARGPAGGPVLELDGLSAIIDFVRGWCASSVERSGSEG